MKMSKLSNQTNSQDPQAVNSRVFVGNLNTFQCSKTDVERMFQRYGRLVGISMHKGYAFVQFTNPFDARNACHGEDGRTVLSQTLDVNMVAEPKPHQTGRKRQNKSKTGNDWDYYYDSYYASTLFGPIQQQPTSQPRPLKRQRLMAPGRLAITGKLNGAGMMAGPQVPGSALQSQQQQQQQHHQQQHHQQQLQLAAVAAAAAAAATGSPTAAGGLGGYYCNGSPNGGVPVTMGATNNGGYINNNSYLTTANGYGMPPVESGFNGTMSSYTNGQHLVGPFKVYSNPDTLICGNCREMFTDLTELLDHKKSYCKLRFTCKCASPSMNKTKSLPPSAKLVCVACKDSFSNPWDLMVHAQAAHMVNIYELGGDSSDEDKLSSSSSSNLSTGSIVNASHSLALPAGSGSPQRMTQNGADKSNGTRHEEMDHDDKDKSCEHNEDSDAGSSCGRSSASSGSANGLLQGASSTEDIHLDNGGNLNGHSILVGGSGGKGTSEAQQPTRACIMTALSIDTKNNPEASVALKMVTSTLGISLTNGVTATVNQ
ncbi:uncharacterized protein LOC129751318 [Uranotaenia lowii]|uniref:uncharacterized protein LOC129751318 n=1 Tax=Uranotaenia lowii TaxID=190385 RepID=UPI00247A2A2D|nr:uncharacterized protein LOC129751318 [Uranotaenia lowii]XP_055602726.1 uncharacterized protein LOC129751318 [Uranotaenia lowii]